MVGDALHVPHLRKSQARDLRNPNNPPGISVPSDLVHDNPKSAADNLEELHYRPPLSAAAPPTTPKALPANAGSLALASPSSSMVTTTRYNYRTYGGCFGKHPGSSSVWRRRICGKP
jgi:hypothetical protein